MIATGHQPFVAPPWRPALEQFAGRHVQGGVRGQSISWDLWRGRTVGLPPM
jgi:hypothetical protein